MRRSLTWYWPMHLAVVAGAAVAAAVLVGALVVGDSVRGSLRALALERLGRVDAHLTAPQPLDEEALERLRRRLAAGAGVEAAPVLAVAASAVHAERGSVASDVRLLGVDGRFLDLFPDAPTELPPGRAAGQIFPPVVLNEPLAGELGAEPGDAVLLSFERWSDVPRESLLGRTEAGDVMATLRLEVVGIVPDTGAGGFQVVPSPARPRNAYLSLADLRRALGRGEAWNAALFALPGDRPGDPPDAAAIERLRRDIEASLGPADLGIELERGDGWVAVESRELVLAPPLESAARAAAAALGRPALPVLVHLANRIASGERSVPYSTVAALPPPSDPALGRLVSVEGGAPPPLSDDEILLDAWTAGELEAAVGDVVELAYYLPDSGLPDPVLPEGGLPEGGRGGTGRRLAEATATFRVAGVVAMEGLAVDAGLVPEVPGVSDAETMAGWDPPFPVDLSRVGSRDEEYWELHGPAPKAFVSLAAGTELWASRFGSLTSLRVAAAEGETEEELARLLAAELDARLAAADLGFRLDPVRAAALEAAAGNTDFAGLFLGFSLFLIAAAGLLAGLLFRLAVERRAGEAGLLLAIGYRRRSVRGRLLGEGATLAAIGGAVGVGLALVYARLVLTGLGGGWGELLGGARLSLVVEPASLAGGWLGGLLLVLLVMAASLRRLLATPVTALLAGATSARPRRGSGRRAGVVALVATVGAGALLAVAAAGDRGSSPALFFAAGAALLTAGCAGLAAAWRPDGGALSPSAALLRPRMAARDAGRNPGRSLLAVVLVACASFVLVAVAANRREVTAEEAVEEGGGGFEIFAESDVPLHADLGDPESLFDLGQRADVAEAVAGSRVVPMRLVPGEDASCLNLYQPTRPRLLGVPPELGAGGGFHFSALSEELVAGEAAGADPWSLLDRDLGEGRVPAFGDAASVRWILHLGLGDALVVEDGHGRPLELVIVGLLEHSLFQSELLLGEAALARHFPRSTGHRAFLVDVPEVRDPAVVAAALETGLARWGLDAVPVADRLAAYARVESTYLSTFQVLGGLGLLLGTLGLGVVLVRSVLDRRAELAAMRAFGFRRGTLATLVLAEHGLLLAAGLAIGGAAGLVAVLPHLVATGADLPWGSLAATFAAVLAAGAVSSLAGVAASLRAPLIPELKREA